MSELSGLTSAIVELNELWTLCTNDELGEHILDKRNKLKEISRELRDKVLQEDTKEFIEAQALLKEVTDSAKSAKEKIDKEAEFVETVAKTIEKAAEAIAKIAPYIAAI